MTSLELTVASPRDSETRRIVADHMPFCLGRALDNDLPLPFGSVSGHHLRLESVDGDAARVTDLNSTNGTRVDDRRLPPRETVALELPVRLTVGDVEVTLRRLEDEAQTAFTMAQSSTRLREMVDEAVRQSRDDEDRDTPFFEILAGPQEGRRVMLEPGGPDRTVGTGPDADIEVPVRQETGVFATVSWREGGCWLEPRAAAVRFDQQLIEQPRRLRSGDRFRLHDLELLYFDPLGEALESLEPGLHGRTGRDSDPAEPAGQSPDEQSAPNDQDPLQDSTNGADQPPGADQPDEPDDPPREEQPAPKSGGPDSATGLGAVELVLVAMSLFFLVGTLVLLAIFLTA